jgi:Pyridoxamine 5'-phosphate oxidase
VGKIYSGIDEKLAAWIEQQHLFFVGSAPLAADGHVNISPKGDVRWFRILGPTEVAYLDFVGSGAETIAHARENGRIVVMFCAFDGPPRIVRLHGRAEVLPPDDALAQRFELPEHPVRSVIRVDVERIADSCGYGVPLMRFEGKRTQYDAWMAKKLRDDALDAYVADKNTLSIDGLPAVGTAGSDSPILVSDTREGV